MLGREGKSFAVSDPPSLLHPLHHHTPPRHLNNAGSQMVNQAWRVARSSAFMCLGIGKSHDPLPYEGPALDRAGRSRFGTWSPGNVVSILLPSLPCFWGWGHLQVPPPCIEPLRKGVQILQGHLPLQCLHLILTLSPPQGPSTWTTSSPSPQTMPPSPCSRP